jgi:membrane protein
MSQKTTSSDSERRQQTAPPADDARKPDDLTDIKPRSWKYVLKKSLREFGDDQATDLAAALTYYGVLAVFPALLAFVSLLGLFGDAQRTTNSVLGLLNGFVPQGTLDAVRGLLGDLTQSSASGFALISGIVIALWSASGYVAAFSRAMNRIYEIDEGRPFWKLRPMTLAVTVMAIVVAVVAAALVATAGPVAERIGNSIGLGDAAVAFWDVFRWVLLVGLAIVTIAVLYYATPNVKQPKFRWMSIGALIALVVWALASLAFGIYVANFSSYNKTYGSIGGVIVFLLWVWIANLALLFGAEVDAELERGRELQAGIKAEAELQLPPRDTRKSEKSEKKQEEDIAEGRRIRESAGEPEPNGDGDAATRRTRARAN